MAGWVRGNSVVDTLPLFDEIKKLSEENNLLKAEVSQLRRRAPKESRPSEEFEQLFVTLNSEQMEVPSSANSKGKGFRTSLLDIFLQAQSQFSAGIENSVGMKPVENWLYFTVGARLQIHSLVNFEKVTGAKYRRCALTQKGANFLSEIAKREAQKTVSAATHVDTDSPLVEPSSVTEDIVKTVPRKVKKKSEV